MSVLWWILAGFVAYWVGLTILSRRWDLPENVSTSGPIITIRTTRGRAFLDRLSRPKRFWRAWGNFGIGVALVIMVGMFLAVVNAGIAALFAPERTAVSQPQNVLVIPGVNEFLPLSVAPEIVIGLVIGLVVHEGGHGLLCRVEDINIESMGVALIGIIPLGAFVQPEERSQMRADRGGKTRMFAAGVMNNFVVTIIAFILLFALVGALIAVAPGAAIAGTYAGSAADDAGIGAGDRIVEFDGTPIANGSTFEEHLDATDQPTVSVVTADGDEYTVDRYLSTTGVIPNAPTGIDRGDRIDRVNDEPVLTSDAFHQALEDDAIATIESDGAHYTFPAGAHIDYIDPDGQFAAAGAVPTGEERPVITAIDDERVVTATDLQAILGETEPGETITIEAYWIETGESFSSDADPDTYEVTLDEDGLIGVGITHGTTGLLVTDFGTQLYESELFLATLGGDVDSEPLFGLDGFFGKMFAAMILPIASLFGAVADQNFAGFTGTVTAFYEVNGPLAGLEPIVFVTANVLFWAGWINFNLGIFNCIPAFPLDGGHLLRSSAESIIARLPIDNRYMAVKYVTVSIGLLMLFGIITMIFGQGLLA